MADPKWEDTEEVQASGPKWDDTEEVPVAKDNSISKGESLLKGAQQGLTAGWSDELAGAIQGGMDKIMSNSDEDSPTEVNAKLKAQGFTGDIGPTSSSEMYTQARDEERKNLKDAQSANPGSYIGGNLAGGALTLAVPGLSAAKGASVAEQAALAAKVGGAAGLGSSEADTVGGQVKDAAVGAATGYGLGRLFPALFSDEVAGAGKNIGDSLLRYGKSAAVGSGVGAAIAAPEAIKQDLSTPEGRMNALESLKTGAEYGAVGGLGLKALGSVARPILNSKIVKDARFANELGEAGDNIRSPEFEDKATQKVMDTVDEAKAPFDRAKMLGEKLKAEAEHKAAIETERVGELAAKKADEAQSKINEIEAAVKQNIAERETAANTVDHAKYTQANKDLAHKAQEFEKIISSTQSKVGQGIDAVSEEIGKHPNLNFDADELVTGLSDELDHLSKATGVDYSKAMEELNQYKGKPLTFDEFRALKNTIKRSAGFGKQSSPFSGTFKRAYGQLNDVLQDGVNVAIDSGDKVGQDTGLLKTNLQSLQNLNQKYTATRELEDVIDRARKSYSAGESYGTEKNIPFLRKMGAVEAETLQPQEQFKTLFNTAAPEQAPQFINEVTENADQLRQLGKVKAPDQFEPNVSQSQVNQEMQNVPGVPKLQAQLKPKPVTIEPEYSPAQISAENTANDFTNTFGSKDLSVDKRLASTIVNSAAKYDTSKSAEIKALLDQYAKLKGAPAAAQLETRMKDAGRMYNLGKQSSDLGLNHIKGSGPISAGLNAVKGAPAAVANQVGLWAHQLKNDEFVQALSKALVGKDPTLSKMIQGMTTKDIAGRNATMFLIMQNPGYRQQMNDVSKQMEGSNQGE